MADITAFSNIPKSPSLLTEKFKNYTFLKVILIYRKVCDIDILGGVIKQEVTQ